MSTRLAAGGRLIDRRRRLGFQFNGERLAGFAGDSLASALLANDRRLVGRSFKYHRRRGLVGSGPEEPNGLVTVAEGSLAEPNRQATMAELYDGMKASSQNHFPSLEFDIGAAAGIAPQLLPAGFYYKTFMQPRQFWKHIFEPVIRQAAGLGQTPRQRDSSEYEHFYLHTDLLVVGGGISGLTAAKVAAESGARVLIVEQMPHWGGRTPVDHDMIDGMNADSWTAKSVDELAARDGVHMLNRTTLFGMYDHVYAMAVERVSDHRPSPGALRQRIWRIRARRIILATGSTERPLCFRDNDTPGVMLASAVRDYVRNFAVSPGDRTVVAVNNDDGYRTAIALAEAGLEVSAVLDTRPVAEGDLPERVRGMHITVECGRGIAGVKGRKLVRGVRVCSQAGEGSVLKEIDCDSVSVSGGWSPAVHLWSHCGGKVIWDESLAAYRPDPDRPPVDASGKAAAVTAGAASGKLTLEQTVEDAGKAAEAALKSLGLSARISVPEVEKENCAAPSAACLSPSGIKRAGRAKAWVDFQNDVKVSDLDLAVREGYDSSEHAKRYTTLGMATDQGKLSNVNGLLILAENLGLGAGEIGTTTFRPPYTPVTLGAIAGDARGSLFRPVRRTPMDEWHEKNGACWEPAAYWRRPYCYLKDNEKMEDAVNREALRVRQSAGLMDASTLGKIMVKGPDSGRFLDMVFTGMMSGLPAGRCRYGLMCNENGFLMDDGVAARIDGTTYLCHTTTGGAGHIHAWMEDWLQCEWWDWQVYTADLTEQFAQIVLAGPDSRRILEKLGVSEIDSGSLPYMSWGDRRISGLDARIYRVSFSGELSFEIALPASQGLELWNALMEAGREFHLEPFGTEALHVLRAEKGFIMIGEETDGTVTPQDLGLDWAVSEEKKDFLGKRAQQRPFLTRSGRWKLVGLETIEANAELPAGSHAAGGETTAHGFPKAVARITSSYHSPVLNRTVALGLVERGPERMGEIIQFGTKNGNVDAKIVSPVFYDPEGSQLDA